MSESKVERKGIWFGFSKSRHGGTSHENPRFNRVVFNDWGASLPCLLPPMAVKSKPPAVRVVVDSKEVLLVQLKPFC